MFIKFTRCFSCCTYRAVISFNCSYDKSTGISCLVWKGSTTTQTPRICNDGTLGIKIYSPVLSFPSTQKLTIGNDAESQRVGLDVFTGGSDDMLYIKQDFNYWQTSLPIAWDSDIISSDYRTGLIFNTFGGVQNNNFTWSPFGCFFGNCDTRINNIGNFSITNLPQEINKSTSGYVCYDNGRLFINETGC